METENVVRRALERFLSVTLLDLFVPRAVQTSTAAGGSISQPSDALAAVHAERIGRERLDVLANLDGPRSGSRESRVVESIAIIVLKLVAGLPGQDSRIILVPVHSSAASVDKITEREAHAMADTVFLRDMSCVMSCLKESMTIRSCQKL